VKEKPTVGSQFCGAFPSGRIPKATKDVNVYLFIHSSNSCKLYQRIPGNVLKLLRVRVWKSFTFMSPDGIPEHKGLSPAW